MIRAIAHLATMGVRPGGSSWCIEVAYSIVSVLVGSFALMLSLGLLLGGVSAAAAEPFRTFGELIGFAFEFGVWVGIFTCPLPIVLCLMAQVIPWWFYRFQEDPILLASERARVRAVLLAFLPVTLLAAIACGCFAAMAARDPACEILVASTRPAWVHSQVLEIVASLSIVMGFAVFYLTAIRGVRRGEVIVEPKESQCPECSYDTIGLTRCPECGWKETIASNIDKRG